MLCLLERTGVILGGRILSPVSRWEVIHACEFTYKLGARMA